ncbi:MAG: DUF488 domain-containing protein [Propionibacterium sp.]|nr:DUF488 domain-containing protein [Propionibacterium sp.]
MSAPAPQVWTIGHWTCPEDVFVRTLRAAEIDLVVDVRSAPGSRRSPHFDADRMPSWLAAAGIEYRHLPELGGRRPRQREVPAEVNAGWQNTSFKNYADHTLTDEYARGLATLEALAEQQHVAIMCGEPMPWRCHRSLIATTLVVRGWTVWHLSTTAAPRRHEPGAWGAAPLVGEDGTVTYPADAP